MSPGGNAESSTNQSWFTDEQKERAKVAGAWAGAAAGIGVAAWGIFNAFSDSGAEPATDKKKKNVPGTEGTYMYRGGIEKIDIPVHVAGIGVAAWGIFNAFSDSGAEPATDRKKKKIVGTEDTYMYRDDFEKIDPPVHLEAKIRWEFPIAGTVKVNTDARCDDTTGRASYGGLVRNYRGEWVVGFYGNMKGKVSILQAEVEGIYRGLKLIEERGWVKATIETDSTSAEELISEKVAVSKKIAENHPLRARIEDCIELSLCTGARVVHIYREGNKCADKMAKLDKLQEMNYVEVEKPPSAIKDVLLADMKGTYYRRDPKKKTLNVTPWPLP